MIRTFAQLTGLNIAVDPGVSGSVTVDFIDVPWDQALDIILRQNGLTYVLEGNVMRVGTHRRLADETAATRRLAEEERLNVPLQTVSFKLSYARATEVGHAAARICLAAGPDHRRRPHEPADHQRDPARTCRRCGTSSTRSTCRRGRWSSRRASWRRRRTSCSSTASTGASRGTLDPSLGTGTGLVFPNRVDVVGGPFEFGPGNPVLSFYLADVLGTFNLDFALNAAETEGLVQASSPRRA